MPQSSNAASRPPFVADPDFTLHVGDVREVLAQLPADSVDCCVTSPPYWGLRDYGADGQLGLEQTPEEYVVAMVSVFAEVRRLLRPEGTLWLNLGDSYASKPAGADGFRDGRANRNERTSGGIPPGLKSKDLVGIPWRVAFALQADGWWLRSDIVWSKPNPMPESVTDRPTKAHEYVFLLTKSARYFYDADAIREPHSPNTHHGLVVERRNTFAKAGKSGGHLNGSALIHLNQDGRNKRSVWEIPTRAYPEAHFAVFPEGLVEPCILAGCPIGGVVLDPFVGSGTTALVARRLGRKSVGIEINPGYAKLAAKRLSQLSLLSEEEIVA